MDNTKEFLLMLDSAIKQFPAVFKNFDKTKNVQGQLQEMLLEPKNTQFDSISTLIRLFGVFEAVHSEQFTSMEQLWLAFAMKENYNKIWDGKDWQGEVKNGSE